MIDLLIAVAIVAILTAIAIPSYTAYIIRAQRASAKAVLLQTSQAMERYYTVNGSYADVNGNFPLPTPASTAPCVAVAPMDSNAPTYCVTGANPTPSSFLLTATPCGDGLGCPAGSRAGYTDPTCDQLTIDNAGTKGDIVAGAAAGPALVSQCWQG